MKVQFACPACQELLAVDDKLVGQQVRCGRCSQIIIVPREPGDEDAEPDAAGGLAALEEAASDAERRLGTEQVSEPILLVPSGNPRQRPEPIAIKPVLLVPPLPAPRRAETLPAPAPVVLRPASQGRPVMKAIGIVLIVLGALLTVGSLKLAITTAVTVGFSEYAVGGVLGAFGISVLLLAGGLALVKRSDRSVVWRTGASSRQAESPGWAGPNVAPLQHRQRRPGSAPQLQLWHIAAVVLVLVLVVGYAVPAAVSVLAPLCALGGAVISIVGSLWFIAVACQESAGCGLMCVFVPIYSLYFLITRWSEAQRAFLCCLVGSAFSLAGVALIYMPTARSESTGRQAQRMAEEAPSPPPVVVPDELTRLLSRAESLRDDHTSSREKFAPLVASLRAEADALRASYSQEPAMAQVQTILLELDGRIASIPSENPEPEVFAAIAAGETWDLTESLGAGLGSEVGFLRWRLRPAKSLRLDLAAFSQNSSAPVWMAGSRGGGRLALRVVPRDNSAQMRPWAVSRPYQLAAARQRMLLAVMTDQPSVSYGHINGLEFTRIAWQDGQPRSATQHVQYVAADGKQWLVADIEASGNDPSAMALFEASVRSMRLAREGEPSADPYTAESVAACLTDEENAASQMLVSLGSKAEPAILEYLKGARSLDQEKAIRVLAQIGTDKSVAELRRLMRERGFGVGDAARAALRKIAPREFDEVGEALMDLETDNWMIQRPALEKLAAAKPDERRDTVAPALEKLLTGHASTLTADDVAKALAVWANDKTATNLLPLLEENGDRNARHAAMKVLGRLKAVEAVEPIRRWLLLDTQPAVEALTAIGTPAEEVVIDAMADENVQVRRAAVDILREIGTTKCLRILSMAAADRFDTIIARSARDAMQAVRDRAARKPPATRPRTTAPAR